MPADQMMGIPVLKPRSSIEETRTAGYKTDVWTPILICLFMALVMTLLFGALIWLTLRLGTDTSAGLVALGAGLAHWTYHLSANLVTKRRVRLNTHINGLVGMATMMIIGWGFHQIVWELQVEAFWILPAIFFGSLAPLALLWAIQEMAFRSPAGEDHLFSAIGDGLRVKLGAAPRYGDEDSPEGGQGARGNVDKYL